MTSKILLPFKLALIILLLTYGYLLAVYVSLIRCNQKKRQLRLKLAQHWQKLLLGVIGIRVKTTGSIGKPGSLVVSNHISWLDIVVTGSQQRVFFLAKKEVRQWPIIGKLAALAGTLFINRKGHCSRSINQQIAENLSRSQSVLIYAEGTSSDGQNIIDFHPKLFSSALMAKQSIQPVLIQYFIEGQPDYQVAPFIGEDSFHQHLFRLLNAPTITAHVHYLAEITCQHLPVDSDNARLLAKQTCLKIRQQHELLLQQQNPTAIAVSNSTVLNSL